MRKIAIFTLVMVLALSLAACGRRNKAPMETTPSVTMAPTEEITLPTIDPTMGTNIPDPEVDTSMPNLMDPTYESGSSADESDSATGKSGKASGRTKN